MSINSANLEETCKGSRHTGGYDVVKVIHWPPQLCFQRLKWIQGTNPSSTSRKS